MATKTGRPPYEPTAQNRTWVKLAAAGGIEQAHMAGALGITRNTLRKYYKGELANGSTDANVQVVGALFKKATSGANVIAQIWWTKSRMGWKEITTVENTGPDGKPIQQEVTYRWAEPER